MAGIAPDGANPVVNPAFAEQGGSPYEGQSKPRCDAKLIHLANGRSVAPSFERSFIEPPCKLVSDLAIASPFCEAWSRFTATTIGRRAVERGRFGRGRVGDRGAGGSREGA